MIIIQDVYTANRNHAPGFITAQKLVTLKPGLCPLIGTLKCCFMELGSSWFCLNYNSTYGEHRGPLIKMTACVYEEASPVGLIS